MSKIRSWLVVSALAMVGVACIMQIEFVDAYEQQIDTPNPIAPVESPVTPILQTKSANSTMPQNQMAATLPQSSSTIEQSPARSTEMPAEAATVSSNASESKDESLSNDLMTRDLSGGDQQHFEFANVLSSASQSLFRLAEYAIFIPVLENRVHLGNKARTRQ